MKTRYPFAVIKEKIHARRGKVSDFAIGARRVALPVELEAWVNSHPDLAIKVASPDEIANFNEAAIGFLKSQYGVETTAECIVPVPGGRVGMSAFVACLLEPGDNVVVTEPGYPAFARLAAHRHAEVLSVPLDPERAFAPDLGALWQNGSTLIRVLALNYPNNPTGAVLCEDTRNVIRDAAAHGAMIFNDAVYGPLTYEGDATSLLSGSVSSKPGPSEVELHSLTKLYPLGPLSGSFLTGTADLMQQIRTYSEFAWSPMSALQIQATTWCLRDEEGHREKKQFYADQLGRLRKTLVDIGFEPYPTPAGIYVLCRVPDAIDGGTIGSAGQAAEIIMDRFDIAIMPWDVPPHAYLRFSAMYRDEDLDKLEKVRL